MKLGKLVVNASPIISLAKIGHADLLLKLSSDLIIPEGVYQEIVTHKNNDSAVEWIKSRDSSLIRTALKIAGENK
jgi:predicted nucleic acid-binding protein